ncbi:MAG: BCCT family transporter, partial [Proteobacteria bacterium]|nr:BCCT family transporter [Pseudomonadota bacterium]
MTSDPRGGAARTIDPVVFGVAGGVVLAVLAFSLADRDAAHALFSATQDWIVTNLGWFLSLGVGVFLVISAGIALSPAGRIRLAPRDDATPEFPRAAWLAMLFSAGMGIGLVFYGVAEPILHFASPPGAPEGPAAAAREAMRISLFHWGLHAWGIYALTGLALAYFHHRRGLPLALRSVLQPLLKGWTDRWPGKLVDVLAVFATLFGLATSLGLGAMQINAGLARLFGAPQSVAVQVTLIAGITLCATLSLVSGLGRGIRRLSELNVILALALWAFVLVAGPTATVLGGIPGLLGDYLVHLPAFTLGIDPLGDADWRTSWTLFYWAWWISWAPFVGIFVARISRGRTIREFVLAVLLVPTVATLLWFGVLGGDGAGERAPRPGRPRGRRGGGRDAPPAGPGPPGAGGAGARARPPRPPDPPP